MAKAKKKKGKLKAKRSAGEPAAVEPALKKATKKEAVSASKAEADFEKETKREFGTLKFVVIGAVALVAIISMFLLLSQKEGKPPGVVTQDQIDQINNNILATTGQLPSITDAELTPELLNALKLCGGSFNRDFIIKTVVEDMRVLREGNGKFFGNFPRYITCGEQDFPYALKIEDGFVTTTYLDKVQVVTNFTKGIVNKGVEVPSKDMEAGVFIVVVRQNNRLDYRYELQNESNLGGIPESAASA